MPKYVVPTAAGAQQMLEMLLGDKVQPGKGTPLKPEASYVATYVDSTGALVSVCALDLSFGAYAGAAMSGIPAGAAKDAIGAKTLTDMMLGNLAEVMNIFSRLMMSDTSAHLKFKEIWKPGENAAALKALANPARADFSLAIPRYGAGNLSFLVT